MRDGRGEPAGEVWPDLPLAAWADTRDTLHLWTQVVGKVRLALAPMVNHWWQVPLYVTCRGLTTSPVPCGTDTGTVNLLAEGREGWGATGPTRQPRHR
jgi:hypothetical protein